MTPRAEAERFSGSWPAKAGSRSPDKNGCSSLRRGPVSRKSGFAASVVKLRLAGSVNQRWRLNPPIKYRTACARMGAMVSSRMSTGDVLTASALSGYKSVALCSRRGAATFKMNPLVRLKKLSLMKA